MNGMAALDASELLRRGRLGERLAGVLVIDIHVHLGSADRLHISFNDAAGLVHAMDRIGIDRACIFAGAGIGPDYRLGNDLTARAAQQFPDRFIPFAVFNPNYPEDLPAEIERCFGTLGMRGIKLHTGFHHYPVDGPNYRPVFEYANAHGLVVISHGWGGPGVLERLAQEYPHVTCVVAHAGGNWDGRMPTEAIQVARRRENVYLDLASSLVPYGGLERAVAVVGAEKLLYGSDMPWMDAAYQLGRVLFAKISDREKELILGLNAKRVLKLEE
jgi:predicted TIM-barrel fold metal-dependent hydrolase